MDDRFDRTQREAEAAIARAKARGSAARDRRRELEQRIAERDLPAGPNRLRDERSNLAEARDRTVMAQESLERARQRTAEAVARRDPG